MLLKNKIAKRNKIELEKRKVDRKCLLKRYNFCMGDREVVFLECDTLWFYTIDSSMGVAKGREVIKDSSDRNSGFRNGNLLKGLASISCYNGPV